MRNESSSSVRITWPPFNREELIERLRSGAESLREDPPLTRIVLFGSWARGRATAYSDVDLLVIYSGPSREDAFATVHRHIHISGLEPHVYAEQEAESVAAVLAQMTKGGVEIL